MFPCSTCFDINHDDIFVGIDDRKGIGTVRRTQNWYEEDVVSNGRSYINSGLSVVNFLPGSPQKGVRIGNIILPNRNSRKGYSEPGSHRWMRISTGIEMIIFSLTLNRVVHIGSGWTIQYLFNWEDIIFYSTGSRNILVRNGRTGWRYVVFQSYSNFLPKYYIYPCSSYKIWKSRYGISW